eukprot:CAMPEP_0171973030 /NCGR_PEP_ID=MMETSP0993-20121228/225757_1 /TAXON_ID=483369 /ORGANISM="non described non described, Strain CCMP2098" /LENGTH=119 /DNA_ID=CAMNT_0012623735 /DNA_START=274 /DNA_END=633 /DNA_ORIENTATION=+
MAHSLRASYAPFDRPALFRVKSLEYSDVDDDYVEYKEVGVKKRCNAELKRARKLRGRRNALLHQCEEHNAGGAEEKRDARLLAVTLIWAPTIGVIDFGQSWWHPEHGGANTEEGGKHGV